MTEPDLYVVALPEICDSCGQTLLALIKKQTEARQIAHHCPHRDTLIYARIGERDSKRAVEQWIIQGPISQMDAVKIITELGDDLQVFHDPERLN